MEKLYALTDTKEREKQDLYIKKSSRLLDFATYFNSFSLRKWKQYTTLQTLTVKLELKGPFKLCFLTFSADGERSVLEAQTKGGLYEHTFALQELTGDILGFRLEALQEDAQFLKGAYYGDAVNWHKCDMGAGICTFKREEYVKRTMQVLEDFQQEHSWLSVLVVDNGSTLPCKETPALRIIHNRNYGGSGGFTRALIEYVEQGKVDYVLLMDDDIVLEPSVIERAHSLLSCLKEEYQDSFLSGAMLSLEHPTVQYENTAYWGKIRLHGLGKGFVMDNIETCVRNESLGSYPNQYGAWWFCCIPVHRIRAIGYPLPVFLKGDDMEYGIRNDRPVLSMNGIAVWHQSFAKKQSNMVNYFSDRNSFIINNYAKNTGLLTLLVSIIGRGFKRIISGENGAFHSFYLAVRDYRRGFYYMTQVPLDKKMELIRQEIVKATSLQGDVMRLFKEFMCLIIDYQYKKNEYNDFRRIRLKTKDFWKQYMRII
ncbi:glycosyltransferase [Mitsuokella sp. WILCCON 0060]|uniref:glycosyltransferase n=1 Tax=Mitsuokella sp. WILCCON 0060 TaxID=3345341 RepID=UPI003F1B1053